MRFATQLLLLFTFLSSAAVAQLPTSSLAGTVTDPQGAVVSGARVAVTSVATGLRREQRTPSDGRYIFTNLAPGNYTLRVEAQGFAISEYKNVRLEIGHAETLNPQLSIAKAGEVVTVTGGEALIEVTESEVQGQIPDEVVESIPLNGRNFLELAYLLPGNRPTANFDPTKTNTLEVSSAGGFGRGGNIMVDGGDNNDEVVGGTLANFPQDGIQEFQIATNRFTAEVGRSGSGVVNIVTKSGTNDVHGSAFLFFRHKELQALPATFDRSLPTPPFDREQFGGSLGGPIVKDKHFWFFALENREQVGTIEAAERELPVCINPPRCLRNVSAPEDLTDFLLTSRADFLLSENNKLAVRYSFNRNVELGSASLRKPIGTAAQRQISTNRFNSILADWTSVISDRLVNDLIFHIDYFLNEIPEFEAPDSLAITDPAGIAVDPTTGQPFELRWPSLQDGHTFRAPQRTRMNRYQLRNTLAWSLGKHTLRFGGEFQNAGTDVLFDLFGSGRIDLLETVASQDRNGDGLTDDRDVPIAFTLRSAAPVRPPTVPFVRDNYLGLFFQDDWRVTSNFTLNLGLRWDYDDNVLARGDLHRPCADPAVAEEGCVWIRNVLGPHTAPRSHNFGPRFGFAWNPLANTVIRGGYGIYYDRVVLEVPVLELLLDGRIVRLDLRNGSTLDPVTGAFLPDPITGMVVSLQPSGELLPGGATTGGPFGGGAVPGVGIGINVIDNNARHPRVQQFNVGIQQQFGRHWVVQADGVHNFGDRLLIGRLLRSHPADASSPLLTCTDGIAPCSIVDPLTGIPDVVTNIESTAKFWYSGLLAQLKKRPTGTDNFKWGFNISYTLSKTFNFANDDQIPFNGAEDQVSLVLGTNDLRIEKGYSPIDERHRFAFYGTFDIPFGISIAPIWTMTSSVPMDSFVPALSSRLPNIRRNALARDIKTGSELNAAIAACTASGICPSLEPVDPNLEFGDSFNSFDLRITKNFRFGERHNLQLIGEIFNLFNTTNIRGFFNTNYSGFDTTINSLDPTDGSTLSPLGTPIRTAGGFFGSEGPRAGQLAVRWTF